MTAVSAEEANFVSQPFSFHADKDLPPFDMISGVSAWRRKSESSSTTWLSGPERGSSIDSSSINVFVRVRPLVCSEVEEQHNYSCLSVFSPFIFFHRQAERLGVPVRKLSTVPYRFDGVFDGHSSNSDVFGKCAKPLVDRLLNENSDSTLIAFGQTGSGKTFTTHGLQEMCLRAIFQEKNKDAAISIAFFENRGSKTLDLLASRNELDILEHADGSVHIPKLSWYHVETVEDALAYFAGGSTLRSTHATRNNPESSRSHAFFRIRNMIDTSTGRRQSIMTFVDLAGSERKRDVQNHSQERIAEMQEINWSLFTLKQCITDLVASKSFKQEKHVNFRNSKLTLLLKSTFTEEAQKTTFIGCLSPLSLDSLHSTNTLSYMRELITLDYSMNDRVVPEEELHRGLQMFYLEHCPLKASMKTVADILAQFKGREHVLFSCLKKKYRYAPSMLLHAPNQRSRNRKENPLCWRRKDLKKFLEEDLEHGKFKAYAHLLNVTGKQFYSFTVADIIRRCGGGSKCAAFNDPEHALHDKTQKESKESAAAAKEEAMAQEEHERNAIFIFEAFRRVKNSFVDK